MKKYFLNALKLLSNNFDENQVIRDYEAYKAYKRRINSDTQTSISGGHCQIEDYELFKEFIQHEYKNVNNINLELNESTNDLFQYLFCSDLSETESFNLKEKINPAIFAHKSLFRESLKFLSFFFHKILNDNDEFCTLITNHVQNINYFDQYQIIVKSIFVKVLFDKYDKMHDIQGIKKWTRGGDVQLQPNMQQNINLTDENIELFNSIYNSFIEVSDFCDKMIDPEITVDYVCFRGHTFDDNILIQNDDIFNLSLAKGFVSTSTRDKIYNSFDGLQYVMIIPNKIHYISSLDDLSNLNDMPIKMSRYIPLLFDEMTYNSHSEDEVLLPCGSIFKLIHHQKHFNGNQNMIYIWQLVAQIEDPMSFNVRTQLFNSNQTLSSHLQTLTFDQIKPIRNMYDNNTLSYTNNFIEDYSYFNFNDANSKIKTLSLNHFDSEEQLRKFKNFVLPPTISHVSFHKKQNIIDLSIIDHILSLKSISVSRSFYDSFSARDFQPQQINLDYLNSMPHISNLSIDVINLVNIKSDLTYIQMMNITGIMPSENDFAMDNEYVYSLTDNLFHVRNITTLNLRSIGLVNNFDFSVFSKLKQLRLQNCYIGEEDEINFSNLVNLEILEISSSYNQVSDVIYRIQSLKVLKLRSSIPIDLTKLQRLTNLQEIYTVDQELYNNISTTFSHIKCNKL